MTTLTDWELATLKCAAAAGQGFRPACEEIHRSTRTVCAALKQMGIHDEIRARFAEGRAQNPEPRTDGTIVVLSPEAIHRHPPRIPNNPQARWLTQSWRAA